MGVFILMALGLWFWWRVIATETNKQFVREAWDDIRTRWGK